MRFEMMSITDFLTHNGDPKFFLHFGCFSPPTPTMWSLSQCQHEWHSSENIIIPQALQNTHITPTSAQKNLVDPALLWRQELTAYCSFCRWHRPTTLMIPASTIHVDIFPLSNNCSTKENTPSKKAAKNSHSTHLTSPHGAPASTTSHHLDFSTQSNLPPTF